MGIALRQNSVIVLTYDNYFIGHFGHFAEYKDLGGVCSLTVQPVS